MFPVRAEGFSDRFRQARNSWAAVDAAYRQYTRVLFSSLDRNVFAIAALTELRSFLAEKLKKALVLYQNQEEVFAKDFLHLIVQIDGKSEAEPDLFEQYYKRSELSRVFEHLSDRDSPHRSAAAQTGTPRMKVKKPPAVFETVHETCRRLAFLRDFKLIAQHSTEAIVLGGSLSYGKFYNVSADSDIDLLVVVHRADAVSELAQALTHFRSVAAEGTRLFLDRARKYVELEKSRGCHMISQKLPIAGERPFDVSLHVVNESGFNHILLSDIDLSTSMESPTEVLLDYRRTLGPEQDYFQKSFDGSFLLIPPHTQETEGGFLSEVPFYSICDQRFYLGVLHNLILPLSDFRHESSTNKYRFPALAFKYRVLERLAHERQSRPHESLRLSYALTRSQEFSPTVRQRTDQESTT